jgi:hypothetical protein
MRLEPATLALDALAEAARHNEAPPEYLQMRLPLQLPLGAFVAELSGRGAKTDNASWLWVDLRWGGAKEAAPVDAPFGFELAAVKKGGGSELLRRYKSGAGQLWREGLPCGTYCCQWQQLRRAVQDGCSLQMTVAVLPPSQPATLETTFNVPSSSHDTLAAVGTMLDGPFTDVAVTAGGRTFRAHRVVLAAASPVFLSMLDGDMRKARDAAVELANTNAGAVALLLRHVYGGAIEVPVSPGGFQRQFQGTGRQGA